MSDRLKHWRDVARTLAIECDLHVIAKKDSDDDVEHVNDIANHILSRCEALEHETDGDDYDSKLIQYHLKKMKNRMEKIRRSNSDRPSL